MHRPSQDDLMLSLMVRVRSEGKGVLFLPGMIHTDCETILKGVWGCIWYA